MTGPGAERHPLRGRPRGTLKAMEIWTAGHSTHSLPELVALLRGAGVEALADVRTVPRSRRHPHFAREALARELPARGLRYRHIKRLGGWRRAQPGSPNGGWDNDAFQGYADYALTAEFRAGLDELTELAREARTAVMCAEGLWWRCHRRLIADQLLVRGWRVVHIAPDGGQTEHELTSFAVVDGERITYPPRQGRLIDPDER